MSATLDSTSTETAGVVAGSLIDESGEAPVAADDDPA